MRYLGWKRGPKWGYYVEGVNVDREKVVSDAKELLSKAKKGDVWTAPNGIKHIPIVVSNAVVGKLWKDVDLKDLEVGNYWAAKFGVNVELVKDNEVVGMLWFAL